jgi:hypothetical protein
MLRHMAVRTKGYQVVEGVVPLLAPLDAVMDLQVLQRPALPAPPAIPLHLLHQPEIDLAHR